MVPSYCAEVALPSRFGSGRGPSPQKRNLVGSGEPREALIERYDAIAFATVGLVADDAVGKVAPAREHRDPGLRGGTLDFGPHEWRHGRGGCRRSLGRRIGTPASTPIPIRTGRSSAPRSHPPRRSRWRPRRRGAHRPMSGSGRGFPYRRRSSPAGAGLDRLLPSSSEPGRCPGRVAIAIDTIINLSVHSD